MASWNPLTYEVMDRIAQLSLHFSAIETANILQLSESTARKVIAAHNAAKEQELEKLRSLQCSDNVKTWAAAKFGLDLSEPKEEPQEPPKEEPKDNTAEAFLKLLAALGELHKDLSRLTASVNNLSQDLKAEHEETVKIINANTDCVCSFIKDQKDILNGIKANTRPRRANETV